MAIYTPGKDVAFSRRRMVYKTQYAQGGAHHLSTHGIHPIYVRVSGMGLSGVLRKHYPRWLLYLAALVSAWAFLMLMVVIMLVANNRAVMGERVNGRWMNVLGWLATALMFAAAGLALT